MSNISNKLLEIQELIRKHAMEIIEENPEDAKAMTTFQGRCRMWAEYFDCQDSGGLR